MKVPRDPTATSQRRPVVLVAVTLPARGLKMPVRLPTIPSVPSICGGCSAALPPDVLLQALVEVAVEGGAVGVLEDGGLGLLEEVGDDA